MQSLFQTNLTSVPFVVYSFLSGATLYHKVALLNKATRDALPNAKLLNQQKQLTMKVQLTSEYDSRPLFQPTPTHVQLP